MVASHNVSCFLRLTDSEQVQISDALIVQLMFFYQSTWLGDVFVNFFVHLFIYLFIFPHKNSKFTPDFDSSVKECNDREH